MSFAGTHRRLFGFAPPIVLLLKSSICCGRPARSLRGSSKKMKSRAWFWALDAEPNSGVRSRATLPRRPRASSYYRARYYDPASGRFLSEDPSGFKAGANFYIYVANDPQDSTDPTGLYKLTGFTPEQAVDFNNAVNDLKKKLEGCPSCVSDPSLRNRLLGFLNGGNNGSGINFIFSNTKLGPGNCGESDGLFGRTYIADWKTTLGCQCLPKTIVHELVHQTWKNVFTTHAEYDRGDWRQ